MAASEPVRQAKNIQHILQQDSQRISCALDMDAASSRIEVQCLLQAVLKVNRAYLLTHPERVLDEGESLRYTALFSRRMKGEPIAYILGEREFFGHAFKVTADTLIPRPETELLVELALQQIGRHQRMLDLGTGSGAIAITVAHARPDIEVIAVDASMAALDVARYNANALKANNVRFLQSDWFSGLDGERFDIIVSNPPYIESNDEHLSGLSFEPLIALVSGADGLDDIRRIVKGAVHYLKPGGWLMLEHGYDQAEKVRELLRQSGFSEISSERDLSGIERVTKGCA
jgi:release factor glutamine methyltransferase